MAIATKEMRSASIPDDAIQQFAASLRGDVIQPSDPTYDDARAVYNAMIDKHPALIAQCADVADVIVAVTFGREQGLLVAIRGGGHNGAGLGTVDDGLVIDLSAMKGVHVDPGARTARVGGGATWADVDHATHAFGLATPSGIIATTGVGGLTLGGGLGHLSRKYGLSIDNLLEVDVVLADGRFVTANEREHPDLFWAVRGGGGNFGVVTSFLFKLHPVKMIVGGRTFWPLEQAEEVMRWYRDFLPNAPEELNGFFAFATVPPAPPFPEHLHLQKVCGVVWCFTGPAEQAEAVFAPVQQVGTPLMHGVQPMPFPALQSASDGLYPPGDQWYWRADFVDELSDEAIACHVEYAHKMPTMQSTMHLYPIDGAVHQVANHETAFAYRGAKWASVFAGVDHDPANVATIREWSINYWNALHPYSAGGAYVNMMMEEGQERVQASYRENYARLAATKTQYDPENLFRVNQNIRPA